MTSDDSASVVPSPQEDRKITDRVKSIVENKGRIKVAGSITDRALRTYPSTDAILRTVGIANKYPPEGSEDALFAKRVTEIYVIPPGRNRDIAARGLWEDWVAADHTEVVEGEGTLQRMKRVVEGVQGDLFGRDPPDPEKGLPSVPPKPGPRQPVGPPAQIGLVEFGLVVVALLAYARSR